MNFLPTFGLVFGLALSTTLLLVPIADWVGRRFGITSKFGGRRQSEADARRVSKLGGVALYGGFVTAVLAAQILPVPRLDSYEVIRLSGLLIGGTVVFLVGLLDDIYDLSPLIQFLGQFLGAAIAIVFQIFIEYFNNPLTGAQTAPWPFWVTVAFSLFWLVGMMNTMNWLDGADGLAGGVTFIAGATLFINSAFRVEPAQTSVSLLHLALMGCTLGFVIYNFFPARIFMGGGATFLGYVLGALAIIGGAKMATILLVMGLPLVDSVWQVATRLREGRSPFSGDRGHLHFRLIDLGVSQRQIVVGDYLFCAFFGVLTLITASQVFKFAALGVMAAIVVGGFLFLNHYRRSSSSSSSASSDSV